MFANADSRNQDSDAPQPILLNYAYNRPGSMPGTMAIADQAQPTEIVLIDYNQEQHHYATDLTPEESATHLDANSVSWLDVGGLGDHLTLEKLAQVFNLHPLIVENIVNVPQRPKLEDCQHQLVIITQMINFDAQQKSICLEQVSLILGVILYV